MPPSDESVSAPAAPSDAAWWEDYLDIFYAPSEVFARRRDSGFLVPLLVLATLTTILLVIGKPLLQPMFDAELTRNMMVQARNNPRITPAAIETARHIQDKFVVVGAAFFAFVIPMVLGVVLWLAARVVDAKVSITAACMIAAYSYFPRIIEALLNIGQAYLLDPASLDSHFRLTLSLARFFPVATTSPVTMALLGRVDLIVLWITALLAIGLSVVARIPRSRAAIAAGIVFLVGALPPLLQALRAG